MYHRWTSEAEFDAWHSATCAGLGIPYPGRNAATGEVNADCDNLPFPESERVGKAFIANIGLDGLWVQTSYNGNFRGCYAGIGYTYDPTIDEFVAPPPPEL